MSREWLHQRERTNSPMLLIMRWVALHLGRGFARALLYPGTLYFMARGRQGRQASRRFLDQALGRPARLRDIYRHQLSFATTIVDRVFFLSGRHQRFEIEVHGREHLERRDADQGLLLLGSHLGSFEILRSLAVRRSRRPVKVLMHRDHNERITALLDSLNPEVASTVIPLGQPSSMLRAKEWVDGGGLLGLLGDRVDGGAKTVRCHFFGRPANLPAGPMLLAAALGAPVILCFGLYHGGNRYSVHFELLAERIELPPERREQALTQWTQRYVDRLEYHARSNPYNWFNFYDYWDD